jgi:hypothetical protein
MLSILVATALCFPFPFLYTNDFTSGASNLPHHVWTSAQPYEGNVHTTPDVVMRTIWVHGRLRHVGMRGAQANNPQEVT